MRAPAFWHGDGWADRATALSLTPAAALFDWAGRLRRAMARPRRGTARVLCVGNLVAGGSGKTPVVLSLAAAARGVAVHLLLRGYGGRLAGPLRVDPASHDAGDVGDEALLLAEAAPTWVARDRARGAEAAEAAGARLLILDDGLQNPGLVHDAAVVVVDVETGFGNGRIIPAGPLREPVARGLARARAVVLLGPFDAPAPAAVAAAGLPVLRARLVPAATAPDLTGRPVVAFAGIGRPEKLFHTLLAMGARLVATKAFADHHAYGEAELVALADRAAAMQAHLVTTEKDRARLSPAWRARVTALPITVDWQDPAAPGRLIDGVLAGVP